MAKPRPHHYFTSSQLEQYRPFKQLMRQWQTSYAPGSFVRLSLCHCDSHDPAIYALLAKYFPNSCDADGAYLIKVV